MNILLGINEKHFGIRPKELIKLIEVYDAAKVIKGIELSVEVDKPNYEYAFELAKLCQENNFILNIHSPIFEGFDKADSFLKTINQLADIMGNKINIVMHLLNDTKEHLRIADSYLKYLLTRIKEHNYNLLISIENLSQKALNKKELTPFFEKYPELRFTYDIGHEYVEDLDYYELSEILTERLNNFHIHSYQGDVDHHPITEKDIPFLEKFLKIVDETNFSKMVVLEYSTDFIPGKDMEEKLIKFIKYANLFIKIINEINERKKI